MMDLYLQQGADINCQNCGQQPTALFRAITNDRFQLADWLIQRGAEINVTAASGQSTGVTLAMLAAAPNGIGIWAYPSLPKLDYLIKNGADVKAEDSTGRNALLYIRAWECIDNKGRRAENGKCVAFVDQLVTHGVDVNHQDRSGASALMNAAISCSPDAIKLLLSYGADPALKDKLGKAALDFAMDRATNSSQNSGCNEAVKILMNPQRVSQSPPISFQPEGTAYSRPSGDFQSVTNIVGTYGGTYNGNDEGVFQVDINQDGTATFKGHSDKSGVTYTHAGKANRDGSISFGSANTGAVFNGTVSREGVLTGTWKAPNNESGRFKGGKDVQVAIPPTNPMQAIGSLFGGMLKHK
jgi:hypothetical protein